MTDDDTTHERIVTVAEIFERHMREHNELLDARDVVEAADEFVNLCTIRWGQWRQKDADAMNKLDAANRRYWEKWGEKK